MKTGKFDALIDLIEPLKKDEYGKYNSNKHAGTKDDPMQFPYPIYSETVHELIQQVYQFSDNNPDFELNRYNELLSDRNLEWNQLALEGADVSSMDAQGIMAMLMGLVRGERFCDGTILHACESGAVVKWLERLKKICDEDSCNQFL